MLTQRYWIIKGYDSTTEIYSDKVKFGCFTENAMAALLKALTTKHALTDDEIVRAYARKNTKLASPLLLEVQKSYNPFTLSCGTNPYFVARVVQEEQ
jgi:hypothetical protein